jgi:hypothetical protein
MRALKRLLFRLRPVEKWQGAEGYNALHRLLSSYGLPASPGDFAIGPLRRFFDLALEPGLSDGQRCRIIEHARHWARGARETFSDPAAADALSRAIDAEMVRLDAMGATGRWVISVFEGDATHHAAPAFPDEG